MAAAAQDASANFESHLRDKLMAADSGPRSPDNDSAPPPGPSPYPVNAHSSPHGHDAQIDPSIDSGNPASQDYDMDGTMSDLIGQPDKQYGMQPQRRQLSATKRAAQNRAAQRAFRQRKEAYITKLEKQVKDYRQVEEGFQSLQHENYQLRDYILALQNRILETSADLPPPPPEIHIPLAGENPQLAHARDLQPPIDPATQEGEQDGPRQAPVASMLGRMPENDDALPREALQQLQQAAAQSLSDELGRAKSDE